MSNGAIWQDLEMFSYMDILELMSINYGREQKSLRQKQFQR